MSLHAGTEITPELTEWVVEEQTCESVSHNTHKEHGGLATHYARINCPKCGYAAVKAYCQPFAAYINTDGLIQCQCARNFDAHEIITAVIPIAL